MSSKPGQSSALRVLLVEDSDADSALIASLLDDSDAEVTLRRVKRLAEALELVDVDAMDVAVLDLNLSDSRGIDTFRRFQRGAPELPVVIISGAEQAPQAVRATLRDGAEDYLAKDALTAHALLRALRFALERNRGERARRRVETLRAQERAMFARVARSGTGGVAGRVLGSRPLREVSSEIFEGIVKRLGQIIDLSIDEDVFGTEHDTTPRLRDLAADLSAVMAGPRDVVDVYTAVLAEMEESEDVSKEQLVAYEDAARTVAFELMGYLVSAYRARVVPNGHGL